MENFQNTSTTSSSSCKSKCNCPLIFIVVAVIFGFVGGVFSPLVLRSFKEQLAFLGFDAAEKNVSEPSAVKTDSIAEDKLVTDLIAKNAPGVVSIVISRDVPKARSFFNNPFGGSLPFFFNPFGHQGGNGTPGGDASQGTEKKQVGSGSGFFVSADGLIVTNKHVVSDEQADYTVITNSGTEYPAKVLARDTNNDVAIIKGSRLDD